MSYEGSKVHFTAATVLAALTVFACDAGPEPTEAELPAPELRRVESDTELARMQAYLRELSDPLAVVHSFRAASGDVIDCVPVTEQPALRDPAMRGHVVERAPRTAVVAPAASRASDSRAALDFGLVGADDDGAERSCPAQTVPIRRLELSTLARFTSLDDFRRKHPTHLTGDLPGGPDRVADARHARSPRIEPPRLGSSADHQYAHAYRYVANRGAQSTFSLWNPYTEKKSEFSLSQMWVVRGSGTSLETVEAGWQNYYDLYGDYKSRLFIYFTPDNYGAGGCYNLTCGAFVQTNNSVIVGGAFSEYSVAGGVQKSMTLQWFKDGPDGHWWLRYGDTWVGYYPRSKFDAAGLQSEAAEVDFGGEIIDTPGDGKHTATDMGSGKFASAGWQQAAYQRNIRYIDTGNVLRDPSLTTSVTDASCYSIALSSGGSWGVNFFFGGSGYNTQCQ